jgi:hypothetical protein
MTHCVIFFIAWFLATVPLSEAACPKITRSQAVLRAFQRTHPCPSTGKTRGKCPGYILDHGIPLCLIGKVGDVVENINWQSVAEAKLKDRLERTVCRAHPRACPHQGD